MNKYFVMSGIVLVVVAGLSMAFPLSFYLSNVETSINFEPGFLNLKVGYPNSSLSIGKNSYFEIGLSEATSLFYVNGTLEIWRLKNFSFFIGGKTKIGNIDFPLDNGKIKEIGRGYVSIGIKNQIKEFSFALSYSRFLFSVDESLLKNMVFIFPPNYTGEKSNDIEANFSYFIPVSNGFSMKLSLKGNFRFSDEGVFDKPTFEAGIYLFTTTESIQNSF